MFTWESVKKDQVPHGSGVNRNSKGTGSEKLKCHQPSVRVDVLLIRNTCGAFLEMSLPLCIIQTPKEQTYRQCCVVGSDRNCSGGGVSTFQWLSIHSQCSWDSPLLHGFTEELPFQKSSPSTDVTARAVMALLTGSRASCWWDCRWAAQWL